MKLLALPLALVCSVAVAAKKTTSSSSSATAPSSAKRASSTSSGHSSMTLGQRLTADDPSKVATGLRMALVIPAWEGAVDRTGGGLENETAKSTATNAVGLFIGAADIPVRRLGWLSGVTLARTTFSKDDYTLLRGEANMTWGFTKQIYTKGGANLHKYTSAPIELGANVGLQLGAGLQLNRTLGAEVGLVYMNQKGSKNGANFETRETGLELAVTGTF